MDAVAVEGAGGFDGGLGKDVGTSRLANVDLVDSVEADVVNVSEQLALALER